MSEKASLPTVLLFTTGEGHYSLSQAIKSELCRHFKVVEVTVPLPMNEGYLLLYRWLPALFKIPYLISKKKLIRDLGVYGYNAQKLPKFEAEIVKHQPVACISTYFMCTQTLSVLRHKYDFQLYNIVANPWTIHPVEIIDNGVNCVFDQRAASLARAISPVATIKATGWFVRSEFKPVTHKTPLRQQLELDPDLLTFTLVTGSEGSHQALAILPHLLNLNLPLQLVVVCGSSKLLLKRVTSLVKKHRSQVKVVVLGFTDHLESYLQAADLVLGKAGPNTLFETIAVETPFFALSHISGQEDGNLEIIKEYHLGYVEEDCARAIDILEEIIHDPSKLDQFKTPLKQVADYNKQAQSLLLTLMKQPNQS